MTLDGETRRPGDEPSAEAQPVTTPPEATQPVTTRVAKRPLYPRLLRLRHLTLSAWQRALLGEGAVAFVLLLVAADLATAWTLLVLPAAVAGVVKANDLLAGALAAAPRTDLPPAP